MLEYGVAYLEENERAIEALSRMLTPAAAEAALELAPESDQIEVVAEEEEEA